MRHLLQPSALALALGTPAYGSAAVPAPPSEPPPAALTPHVPMPAVGGPTPHLPMPAVGARTPFAPMAAVPSAPGRSDARLFREVPRPDGLRPAAAPNAGATPRAARPADTTSADTTSADAPWSGDGGFDAIVASVRGGRPAPAAPATDSPAVRAPAPATAAVPVARILGRPTRGAGAGRIRLEVSVEQRELVALQGNDTLLVAAAGVGTGDTLRFGARTWRFATPAGTRRVLGKQRAPVWVPPEWHYVEVAKKRGLDLRHLRAGRPEPLGDGLTLVVRGARVGVLDREDNSFTALPADEEIIIDGVLWVPPVGTENRRVPGQLGAYRLDLGNGYLIHGTPVETTVGTPSSHGCIRLASDALAWVYTHVPVGAEVVIR